MVISGHQTKGQTELRDQIMKRLLLTALAALPLATSLLITDAPKAEAACVVNVESWDRPSTRAPAPVPATAFASPSARATAALTSSAPAKAAGAVSSTAA
jgi:hypothetical protein